ncbi:SDR family oxidoreductase [Acidovorax sp. sif1233]|jgi:NAD(P)-dependent dehydrogenase (short-subunit alcohol dehydrogenase family)|uniref:SDR family NAD(P)-dependent oxidoreductase n=1 Tax=unclassified Acidovorax TaxID=2684926 RepID=UPI001C466C40|nr:MULTISPECIES: SDR family oxidoreductase [unclassified Acidovorax]MBV7430765.1 SDR family oxidoreductase [Acidovorax sp. sif0732]MBV7451871.1 SDR family oxidoreductase [Acidovorax sp. sif0715]MBV7457244.1 SDR family oxidoreductase [Acidovorax sp. sif1233]
MKLKDKVVLVTGAGTLRKDFTDAGQVGNGTACALTFAREGAIVVCADRSLDAAGLAAKMIHGESGRAQAVQMDVTDTAQVNDVVRQLLSQHGRIDVLHNNVGIEMQGDLLEVKDEDWDRVMEINLRGAMATSRAVVPGMRARKSGSIINVSSTASLKWSPMQFLSYSTSKAGLNHMTRVIARQYAADQVRCNCIIPGMIRTPHADALYGGAEEAAAGHRARDARCPMGRQGSPWDIAKAALFLASDDSSYITGVQLVVDGGSSL